MKDDILPVAYWMRLLRTSQHARSDRTCPLKGYICLIQERGILACTCRGNMWTGQDGAERQRFFILPTDPAKLLQRHVSLNSPLPFKGLSGPPPQQPHDKSSRSHRQYVTGSFCRCQARGTGLVIKGTPHDDWHAHGKGRRLASSYSRHGSLVYAIDAGLNQSFDASGDGHGSFRCPPLVDGSVFSRMPLDRLHKVTDSTVIDIRGQGPKPTTFHVSHCGNESGLRKKGVLTSAAGI